MKRISNVPVLLVYTLFSSSFLPPVPSRILGIFIRVYVAHARIARPAGMLMQLNTSLGKFAGRKAYFGRPLGSAGEGLLGPGSRYSPRISR